MKPEPKHEIVVRVFEECGIIRVYTVTEDMRGWVQQAAAEYGLLYHEPGYLRLRVNPCQDIHAVAAYLQSGGVTE